MIMLINLQFKTSKSQMGFLILLLLLMHFNLLYQFKYNTQMGQEQSSTFNCGIFQKDTRGEIKGDQVMKVRKLLQQQRNKYEVPTRDNEQNSQVPIKDIIKLTNRTPQSSQKSIPFQLISHENILHFSNQPFVGSIPKDSGYLQFSQVSLAYLIQSRYNSKLHFPEQQVIKLLQCLIYTLAFLQKKTIKHHDIYPTNIFYVGNLFKLSHPMFATSGYSQTLKRQRFSYLSPQLIMSLRQEVQTVSQYILFKSDIFSLGLIMLEFCSLKPSAQCYDQQNYDIIDANIKDRIHYVKEIYNPKIAQAIFLMLEYQVDSRISAQQLARYTHQFVTENLLQISKKGNVQQIPQQIIQQIPQKVQHQQIPLQVQNQVHQQISNQNYNQPNIPQNYSIPPQQYGIIAGNQKLGGMIPQQRPLQNPQGIININQIPGQNPQIIQLTQQQLPTQHLGYVYQQPKTYLPPNNLQQIQGNGYLLATRQQNQKPERDYQQHIKNPEVYASNGEENGNVTNLNSYMQQLQQQIGNNNSRQQRKLQEESLDQRVKRILQKSKQIK